MRLGFGVYSITIWAFGLLVGEPCPGERRQVRSIGIGVAPVGRTLSVMTAISTTASPPLAPPGR